jgi:predicted transposase/invertase (TIGR01784 family)
MQKGLEKGKQQGRQEGLQQGELEKAKDIALKMLNEGIDTAFISKITDLSPADIERLKNGI